MGTSPPHPPRAPLRPGERRAAPPGVGVAVGGGIVWAALIAASAVRSVFFAVLALVLVAAVAGVALVGRIGGAGAPGWTVAFAALCGRHRLAVFVVLALTTAGALTGLL